MSEAVESAPENTAVPTNAAVQGKIVKTTPDTKPLAKLKAIFVVSPPVAAVTDALTPPLNKPQKTPVSITAVVIANVPSLSFNVVGLFPL